MTPENHEGVIQCDHCSGYGSSLDDPEEVDTCTECEGSGLLLVVDKHDGGGPTMNTRNKALANHIQQRPDAGAHDRSSRSQQRQQVQHRLDAVRAAYNQSGDILYMDEPEQ